MVMGLTRNRRGSTADGSYATHRAGAILVSMSDPHPVLNENQRRHFAVLLVGLDDALHRIELLGDPTHRIAGPLTHHTDDLPSRFDERVRPFIRDLRERIIRLAASLGTGSREHSRARSIRALVTSAVIRLEDSRARGLRGYGAVDASVAKELDPVIDDLMQRFRAISHLLAEGSATAQREGGQ